MISISIVGGPFDGHQHPFGGDLKSLQHDLIWLVCEDAFCQCGYRLATRHDRVTSVAVYTLNTEVSSANYRYVGSVTAQEFSLALSMPQPSMTSGLASAT
jgi:hypothetical protein